MDVRLIAATYVCDKPDEYVWQNDGTKSADELAEIAGRACYKSWDRPNPTTASNEGYISNIIKQRHFSVLEHASATFWITGVSRSLTHELVRHRHLSFSQVSQRYVDETNARLVGPNIDPHTHPALFVEIEEHMSRSTDLYQDIYETLVEDGYDKKAARGAARSVLPNMTETALVVTGNHRTWREVIEKRYSPAADAEIRELARLLLKALKRVAPNSYQDLKEED